MQRPTKCWACGSTDFWQRPDGEWLCSRCHPNPNEGDPPEVSSADVEFEALKSRIKLGNEKLWKAWEQIRELADDKERWSQEMNRWAQAKEKLWQLVEELRQRFDFYDCLYLENGKKTRGCLHNDDGFFCQVCPCRLNNPYWEKELMGLPSLKETEGSEKE